jgi:hypothetical protein
LFLFSPCFSLVSISVSPLLTHTHQRAKEEMSSDKELGNEHFKAGRIEEALAAYTRALTALPAQEQQPQQAAEDAPPQAALIHNNLAACYLKLVGGGGPNKRTPAPS